MHAVVDLCTQPALQRKQTEVHFVEADGKELWAKTFGLEVLRSGTPDVDIVSQNNLVEWNKFIKGFSDYLKINISLRDEMNLKKIMGNEHLNRSELISSQTPLTSVWSRHSSLLSS